MNTDKPLISIITVTFNAGKVIGKTIDSLKEQSFKDFEHLLIDGFSKDDTVPKVMKAGLPQSVIISEPDKGLYDAMNKGLRMAKGEYVLFLNAGDAFHDSETLEKYARKAKENFDIIYGDTIIVDLQGNKISNRHLSVPEHLTKKSFSNGMLVCHQAFMVRKNLAPYYNLSYKFSADYDWCVRCISNTSPEKCCNLKDIAIDYLNDGITDKNKWKSLRERFSIMADYYGMYTTLLKHFSFLFRALRRGKI